MSRVYFACFWRHVGPQRFCQFLAGLKDFSRKKSHHVSTPTIVYLWAKYKEFWFSIMCHLFSILLGLERMPKKPCLGFLECAFVLFLQANIFGMTNYCHHQWKISYNFEMKRRIKIRRHGFVGKLSDNNLPKFQPIWSGAADFKFTIHAQLA